MKTVVGLLKSKSDARDATEQLVASGFSRESIKILASEESRRQYMAEGDTTQEPFFRPGTDFGVLSGDTPLVGMGVLDEDASYYSEGVNRGGFLVTLSCDDDRADFAADILRQCGAMDIDRESRSWREEGWRSRPGIEEERVASGIPSEQVTTEGGVVARGSVDQPARFGGADEVKKVGESYGGRQVADMDDEEFISHFNNTYGQSGERFEETYRSAYHFAESESRNPQLMGREWYEVEDDIHRDWESSHPGTWNKVQQAIHFGWDRFRRHH